MTTFDDRDKAFENKFAHDEEINFKVSALTIRMLAGWAATKMGKNSDDADSYARSVAENNFEGSGYAALEAKLIADLAQAGITVSQKELDKEHAKLLPLARARLLGK